MVNSETLEAAVNAEYQQILQQIKKPTFPFARFNPFLRLVKNGVQKDIAIEEYKLNLYIAHDSLLFDDQLLNVSSLSPYP